MASETDDGATPDGERAVVELLADADGYLTAQEVADRQDWHIQTAYRWLGRLELHGRVDKQTRPTFAAGRSPAEYALAVDVDGGDADGE